MLRKWNLLQIFFCLFLCFFKRAFLDARSGREAVLPWGKGTPTFLWGRAPHPARSVRISGAQDGAVEIALENRGPGVRLLLFFPAPFSSPFCCIPEASSNRGHTKGALNVHQRDGRVAAPPRLPGANPASARRWGRQQRRQVPGSRRLSRGRAPRVYPHGGGAPFRRGRGRPVSRVVTL